MKKVYVAFFILTILLISCGKKGDPYPKKPSFNSPPPQKIARVFEKNG
ncbi:MAG: hypothetical protein ACE14Q_03960 [Acidobacteriota bacterium]|nr:hypothetical protein [Thermoanaerobaculaceae bacterium]